MVVGKRRHSTHIPVGVQVVKAAVFCNGLEHIPGQGVGAQFLIGAGACIELVAIQQPVGQLFSALCMGQRCAVEGCF